MQKQVFFHQYRRPRYNNPTFISNNVNTSLTFFNGRYQNQQFLSGVEPNYYNNFNRNQSFVDSQQHQNQQLYQSRQFNNTNNNNSTNNPINSVTNDNPYRLPSINSHTARQRQSNLSAYGSTSLSMNQKDIYNKQNSNYNIITMKPKQYDTSIRQHPTLTVENKDQMYYKRMTEQLRKKTQYNNLNDNNMKLTNRQNSNHKNQPINSNSIAGKYTYGLDKNSKPSANTQIYQQQYLNSQINQNLPVAKPNKQFTPKLLNHMDELISLS